MIPARSIPLVLLLSLAWFAGVAWTARVETSRSFIRDDAAVSKVGGSIGSEASLCACSLRAHCQRCVLFRCCVSVLRFAAPLNPAPPPIHNATNTSRPSPMVKSATAARARSPQTCPSCCGEERTRERGYTGDFLPVQERSINTTTTTTNNNNNAHHRPPPPPPQTTRTKRHGMGDSCCAAGSMGAIKSLIEEELGAHTCGIVVCCTCVD